MMTTIYTLWAALPNDDLNPWMIAAEDETSWEADPERCAAAFDAARTKAGADGYEVREVYLQVDWDAVGKAFQPQTVPATVKEPK